MNMAALILAIIVGFSIREDFLRFGNSTATWWTVIDILWKIVLWLALFSVAFKVEF